MMKSFLRFRLATLLMIVGLFAVFQAEDELQLAIPF
jgi:hypothetical protein